MLGRRKDLPLRHGHILLAPCHNKDGLLSPHRCLNVGVGLGPERLNLTACQGSRLKRDKEDGCVISDSVFKNSKHTASNTQIKL